MSPLVRVVVGVVLSASMVAACAGGGLSLSEYAASLEMSVGVMNARIDGLDVAMDDATSVDQVVDLWGERVAARETFVAELRALDPPDSAAELHDAALDVLDRLAAAEAAMEARAATYADVNSLWQVWESPEGRVARAIDDEAVAICRAAQSKFDDTADREVLSDVPWITNELKEVIDVVFGCTEAERQANA